jgi:hypothetical protein
MRNNSAGAWLLCAFASGEGRSACRGFMASRVYRCLPTAGLASGFFTYQQFHSDGVEIETPMFTPGVCMGTWKQTGHMVQIYHVGWTPGGIPGAPTSVRFVFTETLTVSNDRNSYDGTVDQTFYDAPVGGNAVAHCTSTTHATRISVNRSDTTPGE